MAACAKQAEVIHAKAAAYDVHTSMCAQASACAHLSALPDVWNDALHCAPQHLRALLLEAFVLRAAAVVMAAAQRGGV